MTIQVKEVYGSRTISIPANGTMGAKRVFLVYDDTGAAITGSAALSAPTLPQYEDGHPENRDMLAIGVSVEANNESESVQQVEWTYEGAGQITTGGDYNATTVSTKGSFVDMFRNNFSVPGGVTTPAASDIGGNPVDAAGVPISAAIAQCQFGLRSPFSSAPPFSIINSFVNTRNSRWFQGFPPGMVLYLGVNATKTNGNVWTTVHNFAADELYHMRQICARGKDGKPLLTSATDADGTSVSVAGTVYFRQVFQQMRDFAYLMENASVGSWTPTGIG